MTDDLPFLPAEPDPSRPERPARRCYRHAWCNHQRDSWFSRSMCAGDDWMHTYCADCSAPLDGECAVRGAVCLRCGKVRDEAVVKRNRNNRKRGSSFERDVAKQLGGRRTGPLGGRDDVMVDNFCAVQTKKDTSLSLNKARLYLTDLGRTFPDRVPLVIHANPGRNPEPVVILPLATWLALHGPIEEDAAWD